MKEADRLNHIEIQRENDVREYRFRSNPSAPKPPIRDFKMHGQKIKEDIEKAKSDITTQRQSAGVESDKLMILSITQNAMSSDLLDNMLRKFELSLIEEIGESNHIRLLVQFPNSEAIDNFNRERELWEEDYKGDGILTYAQRRDTFSCIDSIRGISKEDRMGERLKKYIKSGEPLPEGFFVVDIDVWHNGDRGKIIETESLIKRTLGNVGSKLLGDLFETPSLLLGRVSVNEFSLEALLGLDVVATIDLPMGAVNEEECELLSSDFEPLIQNNLDENAPLAAVLDSGIFSAHPLLKDLIVGEEDFDQSEGTTSDKNGHGTGVAGIVAYGDFESSIGNNVFSPLVRICSGKVMHNENFYGNDCPVFREDIRPEIIVKEAIEYFNKQYGCRVFNLSAGSNEHIYNGGRQMAWAEVLDNLARELDIVIIISAGNVSNPILNETDSRETLHAKSRDQLFDGEHKLIDPATASLCVTVGSISRFDEPEIVQNRPVRISSSPKNAPSVFTRIGKGVNKAIKPELVDFGGNYAVHQTQRGTAHWLKIDKKLSEKTLSNNNSKLFRCCCGTSFAAPRVTHLAARIEREFERQFDESPSANLVRALLVNSATITDEMKEWAELSTDCNHSGKNNPKQERRLRLIGYGQANQSILNSGRNSVTLFAEDKLQLRSFHLYKIPIPVDFLKVKCNKKISISMAYNPVTRLSRKDYLANNMWFEVYRKIDEERLAAYKAKREAGLEDELPSELDNFTAEFFPGRTEVDSSTLQQRVWCKSSRGGADLLFNENEPYIWVLVAGKERFKHPEQEQPQDYALVITFSFDGEQDIQLYNKVKEKVRIKQRQIIRTRTQVRI